MPACPKEGGMNVVTKYKDKLKRAVYELLKMQCAVIGKDIDSLDYNQVRTSEDPINSSKKCFYEIYSWTPEQEEEYKDKFIKYLQGDAAARRELGCLQKTRKYILEHVWPWWCLQFTFKYKKGENK